jgi:hypothetical protein
MFAVSGIPGEVATLLESVYGFEQLRAEVSYIATIVTPERHTATLLLGGLIGLARLGRRRGHAPNILLRDSRQA